MFLALDLFVFFVFFEIVLVPMYFLIGGWGYDDGSYAARSSSCTRWLGSAFLLVGDRGHWSSCTAGDTAATHVRPGQIADSNRLAHRHRSLVVPGLRRRLRREGAAVPAAHVAARRPHQAPTAGSVILAGVMLKLGTYGFLRFGIVPVPRGRVTSAPVRHARGDRHHLRRHRAPMQRI